MANGQWLKAVKDLRSPKAPQNRFNGAKRQVPLTGGGFRGWVTHGFTKDLRSPKAPQIF